MAFSTGKRDGELTNSSRIAVGLFIGVACFSAVVTGGLFIGLTFGVTSATVDMQAPVQVDPLQ